MLACPSPKLGSSAFSTTSLVFLPTNIFGSKFDLRVEEWLITASYLLTLNVCKGMKIMRARVFTMDRLEVSITTFRNSRLKMQR